MDTPWMDIARAEIGQKQWSPGDNPRVLEYLAYCGFTPQHDEGLEWCGAFAGWVIGTAGLLVDQDTPGGRMVCCYPPWWRNFGAALSAPQVGAIAVKKTGLHVTLVEKVNGTKVDLLGGNQDDAVKIWTGKRASDFTYRMPG